MIMQVEPGGLRRHFRDLSGFVKDVETSAALSGVRVSVPGDTFNSLSVNLTRSP